MTEGTTRRYNDGEVLSGVQRRRRWTLEEKVRIVEETYLPGMSVSLVARQNGISGSQVFTWRRRMNQGALTAAAAGEEVVPASDYPRLGGAGARVAAAAGQEGDGERAAARGCLPGRRPKKLLLRSTSLPGDVL
jgi:transposase